MHERIVYGNVHSCILNNMKYVRVFYHCFNVIFFLSISSDWLSVNIFRFSPTNSGSVYAASSDGTISFTDLETGISSSLMNLNPDGWQV